MSRKNREQIMRQAIPRLAAAGIENPARDAQRLLGWACGLDGAALRRAMDTPMSPEHQARFCAAIAERAARRPLAQIVGYRMFWKHRFIVTPDVLDPRPETETLVATAIAHFSPAHVLDLGVGSGAILLSLLSAWPQARGLGVDQSLAALSVARRNAQAMELEARAYFHRGNWGQGLCGVFDLIVSNPYIGLEEMAALAPEVREYEPWDALCPGTDGLGAYRIIAGQAPGLLRPGGAILLEIGSTQAQQVSAIFHQAGFRVQPPITDYNAQNRVILAQI